MGSRVLRAVIKRWERFWFEDVPSDIFSLLRMTIGAAGLISLIGYLPVDTLWAPNGIAPLPTAGGIRDFLLQSGLGSPAAWCFFLFLFAAFMCMTLGLFTKAAVAICFIGTVVQARWNSLPLTSGHTVLVAVLFCLVWADCGHRLSLDSKRKGRGANENERQPVWPLRLIRIQVAIMYATSGLFKLLSPAWRSGAAVHYTTSQNIYGRLFHVYAIPPSLEWILTVLTYSALWWEMLFPLMLLHRKTRPVALIAGIAIHLGIWATMEVGPFTWVMIASYVAFLEPENVARLTSHPRRLAISRVDKFQITQRYGSATKN